ncbi:spindle assembly checkpoint kinase [Aspergillus hancockii]|nr:spindle assembly checkpoint kinase [Aspergillus hancockii]
MEISRGRILPGVFHAPSGRRLTKCGTFGYLPPEMVDPKKYDKPYDERVDLWALGVSMHEVLVGKAPFEDTPAMTQRRIASGNMIIPSFVSSKARDLVRRLLALDSGQRITLENVLQHPWSNQELMRILESALEDNPAAGLLELIPESYHQKHWNARLRISQTEQPNLSQRIMDRFQEAPIQDPNLICSRLSPQVTTVAGGL